MLIQNWERHSHFFKHYPVAYAEKERPRYLAHPKLYGISLTCFHNCSRPTLSKTTTLMQQGPRRRTAIVSHRSLWLVNICSKLRRIQARRVRVTKPLIVQYILLSQHRCGEINYREWEDDYIKLLLVFSFVYPRSRRRPARCYTTPTWTDARFSRRSRSHR